MQEHFRGLTVLNDGFSPVVNPVKFSYKQKRQLPKQLSFVRRQGLEPWTH